MTPDLENYQFSSKKNDWWTPEAIIDAAKQAMGGIELDPASEPAANTFINADRYFTIDDDGLSRLWDARSVFLNPPYGRDAHQRSIVASWVQKLIIEYRAGHVKQAILLVNAQTSEHWFQPLWAHAELICFTSRRLRFWRRADDGTIVHPTSPTRSNAIAYFSRSNQDIRRFIDAFSPFGPIVDIQCVIPRPV